MKISKYEFFFKLGGRLCAKGLENIRKWMPQAVSTLFNEPASSGL
jgi:hypothetical protein